MRKAKVLYEDKWAGTLTEDDMGYHFQYKVEYLADDGASQYMARNGSSFFFIQGNER